MSLEKKQFMQPRMGSAVIARLIKGHFCCVLPGRRIQAGKLSPILLGTLATTLLALILIFRWSQIPAQAPAENRILLSVFEPHAGGCPWYQIGVDPKSQASSRQQIAMFHTTCQGVRVRWSPRNNDALVWFKDDVDSLLWRVAIGFGTNTTTTGRVTRLSLPADGEPAEFAFHADGDPMAFTVDQNIPLQDDHDKQKASFAGKNWEIPSPYGDAEVPALAHTYRLNPDSGGWQRVETAGTRCCTDALSELFVLKGFRQVSVSQAGRHWQNAGGSSLPESELTAHINVPITRPFSRPITGPIQGMHGGALQRSLVEDNYLLSQLDPLVPSFLQGGESRWVRVQQESWEVSLLALVRPRNLQAPTGLIFFEKDGSIFPVKKSPYGVRDLISIQILGSYLLVSDAGSGMRPRFYHMAAGNLTYHSDSAHSATFWPTVPAKAAPTPKSAKVTPP